jgi:hypothetical protein
VGTGLVWYAAYGSNLSSARLRSYLAGGLPTGGSRVHPGARDPSPPRADVPLDLPGSLFFAGDSSQWGGGGVALYDPTVPGPTAARAYLLTVGQLVDLAAQEMYRVPRDDDPLEAVLAAPLPGGRHEAGPGLYETLVEVGRRDGLPVLTFTSPHGRDAASLVPPSPAYAEVLFTGLAESRGWGREEFDAYLARVTG